MTVHFDAVQTKVVNGTVITVSGVVRGVVTDGWLKGNIVEGEYTRYACTQVGSVNGFCFDRQFRVGDEWLIAVAALAAGVLVWQRAAMLPFHRRCAQCGRAVSLESMMCRDTNKCEACEPHATEGETPR